MIVKSGDERIDNRKLKESFGKKKRMMDEKKVMEEKRNKVGGVCKFGLKGEMKVLWEI